MRLSWGLIFQNIVLLCLLLRLTASLGLACDQVTVDGITWDLSELGGPQSVMHTVDEIVSFKNTTYTIDICQGLILKERNSGDKLCPFGSRVCAMERIVNENTSILERGWPIAGELKQHAGGHLDEKWERLKTPSSSTDLSIEGIRLHMNGGFFIRDDGKKRSQKAIVEFICDKTRTGTENLITPEDEYILPKTTKIITAGEFNKIIPKNDDNTDPDVSSLAFVEYNQDSDDLDVLHLSWRTKFACEDAQNQKNLEKHHWGFFTWIIVVAFFAIAFYLIYVSWLNYNKGGARGWNMLPHADMIQDIPYLLKDWIRRVLISIQGDRSRRGYAAV